MKRRPYPSNVSEEELAFVMPYLTLLPLDAAQRKYDLRQVSEQARRRMQRGVFENLVHDLRETLRQLQG